MPSTPPGYHQMIDAMLTGKQPMNDAQMMEMNQQAADSYAEANLTKCPHCNRKFKHDTYKKHQQICTAERPINVLKQPAQNVPQSDIRGGVEYSSYPTTTDDRGPSPPKVEYKIPQDGQEYQEIGNLATCSKCQRSFATDRIGKHQQVCRGNVQSKYARAALQKQERRLQEAKQLPKLATGWRDQHAQFKQNLEYARRFKAAQENGEDIRSIPGPPPSKVPDDYVFCPHCQRNFNPQVAQKHIPICKNTENRPKPPPGTVQSGQVSSHYGQGARNVKPANYHATNNTAAQNRQTNQQPGVKPPGRVSPKPAQEPPSYGRKTNYPGHMNM